MAIGKGTDEFGASFVDAVVVADADAAAPGAVGEVPVQFQIGQSVRQRRVEGARVAALAVDGARLPQFVWNGVPKLILFLMYWI